MERRINISEDYGEVLYKVFKYVVNELRKSGESGSEVSQFIPEPSNFSEVSRLPADVKKECLKEILKYIKCIFKNQTFRMDEPYKGDPVTTSMDVYKETI